MRRIRFSMMLGILCLATAARAAEPPPGPQGELAKELIQRAVMRHRGEIRACYVEGLRRNAKLAGKIVIQFVIAPSGAVSSSALQSSTLNDSQVEQCVLDRARGWTFPKPTGGEVAVSYPFAFAPADAAPQPAKAPAPGHK